jgi:hypothetical protein
MRRFGIMAIVVGALLATTAPAATAAKRLRPTDVPRAQLFSEVAPNPFHVFNDYATPARFYASQRAVAHYVLLGIDAPPLNDDDVDGVPDYVERVGEAADTAIRYYDRRGFARILADSGGPDGRPDLYISRFTPGYFGVAFPGADAEGGAFVAVSNALDPSPATSLGSVYGTVAHEVFHLVQFSYFPSTADPDLAAWALEGMAAAMESRVYPDLDDIVSSLQLRRWFAAPQRSMTSHTYGSQLLWRFLDERQPRLLPAYLARSARARGDSHGASLVSTYERVARAPFSAAFDRFAAWTADWYGDRITPLRRLARREQAVGSVAPLAIHYLRLSRSTRAVSLRFTRSVGEATLTYQLASDRAGYPAASRRLRARLAKGGRQLTYAIPAPLRRNDRLEAPTLVVTNGNPAQQLTYRVATR